LEQPAGPVEACCPTCSNTWIINPSELFLTTPIINKSKQIKKSISGWVIAGYIFAVLGGWLGGAIALGILFGDKKDKKHGISILVLSVISKAFWTSALK